MELAGRKLSQGWFRFVLAGENNAWLSIGDPGGID
jgi:hypothetical protein